MQDGHNMDWEFTRGEQHEGDDDLCLPTIYRVDYIDTENTLSRDILVARITLTDEDRRGAEYLNFPILRALREVFWDMCLPQGPLMWWRQGIITVPLKADPESLRRMCMMADDYSDLILRILDLDDDLIPGLSSKESARTLGITRPAFTKMVKSGLIRKVGIRAPYECTVTDEFAFVSIYSIKDVLRLRDQFQ